MVTTRMGVIAVLAGLLTLGRASEARGQSVPAPVPSPPATLPLASLLDSAGLHRAIASLPDPAEAPRVSHVFQVSFDKHGQPERVEAAVPSAMDSAYLAFVGARVRASLRAIPARADGYRFILQVRAGRSPLIRPVVLDAHPPSVIEPELIARELGRRSGALLDAHPEITRERYHVLLRFHVGSAGEVIRAEVFRGSGVAALDSAALAMAPRFRFRPATLDGVPAPAWATLPLRFEFPDLAPPPSGGQKH